MTKPISFELEAVERAVGRPFAKWAHQCHEIALHIVRSDLIQGPRRVARGHCQGVPGQHSWVVLGDNCYAEDAGIIDPTLWSYDDTVKGIWYGSMLDKRHHPHGEGSIWEWGKPVYQNGEPIELEGLSPAAQAFMKMLYPLDLPAWQILLSRAPVQQWPAREIYAKAAAHKELRSLIPIDRLGMLTDLNPGGLYLPNKKQRQRYAAVKGMSE